MRKDVAALFVSLLLGLSLSPNNSFGQDGRGHEVRLEGGSGPVGAAGLRYTFRPENTKVGVGLGAGLGASGYIGSALVPYVLSSTKLKQGSYPVSVITELYGGFSYSRHNGDYSPGLHSGDYYWLDNGISLRIVFGESGGASMILGLGTSILLNGPELQAANESYFVEAKDAPFGHAPNSERFFENRIIPALWMGWGWAF